ncbi:hypothetical protein PC123_g28480 [Phytophthora cactorum]|nr:hypothetical protein PC123_g28480 [Phytophthora cactorum]
MTDSGKCAFVLGIELVDGPDGSVTMCQRRYVDDILKRFGMDECKAVVSPVDMSTRLVPSDAATKVNAPFREAVGALMHLMNATRPDIAASFATCKAPRRMESASSRVTTSTFAGTPTRTGLATSRTASRLPATRSC